jgi:hypothetical protein
MCCDRDIVYVGTQIPSAYIVVSACSGTVAIILLVVLVVTCIRFVYIYNY